jgi:hypothetical protein
MEKQRWALPLLQLQKPPYAAAMGAENRTVSFSLTDLFKRSLHRDRMAL